ncbi:hypothetical protein LCGC14_1096470 [marine sediment metagenome]|uniref:DUF932 domain-containing protein n=1 Tax=marine sediment metagenome TaxID=412755 RepID=A0A0F9MAS9_9ZZZZ
MSIVNNLARRRYTDKEVLLSILEKRKRETYKIEGISKIFFDDLNRLNFRFNVKESDEFQFGIYSSDMLKEWYLPKHAFSQLATYLDIPVRVYDFIHLGRHRLDKNELEVYLENLTENMELLCRNRLEREKDSKRLKAHYLTVFDDIFGSSIRRVSSEIYRPYEDYKAFMDTDKNLKKLNNAKGTDFQHRETYLSPFKLTSNFINEKVKIQLKNVGDTIKAGISLINSETKDSSFGFQALMFRLACSNGMISEFKDAGLTVKHMGDDFELHTKKAFIKVLELGKNFAKMYVDLDRSKPISNDWNDLHELPDSLFQMRTNERKELIEIAQKENYPFSAYGLVQTLTFKSNHDAISDSKFNILNKKALDITRKVDGYNNYILKRNRAKKQETVKTDDSIILGNLDLN